MLSENEIWTIGFGVLAALIAAIALFMASYAAGFTRRNAPIFTGFAGGLVIALALLHLIPEAFHIRENAQWLILIGFGAGFLVHGAVDSVSGRTHKITSTMALASVLAIGLHSMLDGMVYAVSFKVDIAIGLSAAGGLALHEFPEALICFILLQRAGLSDRLSALAAFCIAGLTTLLASVVSLPFTNALEPATLGALFAFVAGMLLHVGATHLLHEAHAAGLVRGAGAGLAGALVASVLILSQGEHSHLGHDHHEHDHDHEHSHDHANDVHSLNLHNLGDLAMKPPQSKASFDHD